MPDLDDSSLPVESDRPFARLAIELAETLVLLDYLATRPEGLVWPVVPSKAVAQSQAITEKAEATGIERDLASPTTAVRRIYQIRSQLPYYDRNWDIASDAAFLSRAKSTLSELAAPATSLTIAFTSMVMDANVGAEGETPSAYASRARSATSEFSGPVSRIAYPNLKDEARRLSWSIGYLVPYTTAFVTILAIVILALANTSVVPPNLQTVHWLANAALSGGAVPALLGLLGALASVLRRFQHLSAASLLDPGLRSKNWIDVWLGFIAGSGVGFFIGLTEHSAVRLGLYVAAFLVGYSTEIAFSWLDLIILRLSQIQFFRGRTTQLGTVLKTQSAIADTVTQIHNQIEQIQGNVTLDPFDGAVTVYTRGVNGSTVPIDEYDIPATPGDPAEAPKSDRAEPIKIRGVKLASGQSYELVVMIERSATNTPDRVVEAFSTGTGTGNALRSVVFDVELKGRGVRFTPKNQTLDIAARSQSSNFVSQFVAPTKAGRYDIFAEVSQKNRLVKVALLPAIIEGGDV